MPASPMSSTPLKSRLLGGASLGAMVLAASFAVTSPAMAQTELVGPSGDATDITTGQSITNNTVDNAGAGAPTDFGSVDTEQNGNDTAIGAVTITEDATLYVFDSNDTGEGILTMAGTGGDVFTIGSDDTFTVSLGTADNGGQSAFDIGTVAIAAVEGINGGNATTRGGTLALTTNQATDIQGTFTVNLLQAGADAMLLSGFTVSAGDAEAAGGAAGSAIDVNLGAGQADTVDITTATFTAGNASDATAGGAGLAGGAIATSSITADTTIGALTLQGGGGSDSNAGNNGADGGAVDLTVTDTDGANLGAIVITAGNGGDELVGTGNAGNGGNATLTVAGDSVTLMATTIQITGGLAGANNGTGTIGLGGTASLVVAGDIIATGGIAFAQNDGGANLTLNGGAQQTVTGTITDQAGSLGTITINNTDAGVRFANDIGTSAARMGLITVTDGDLIEFDGNVFSDSISLSAGTTARFDGAMSVLGESDIAGAGSIIVGNGTDAAQLTFTGDAGHGGGTELSSNATLVVDATGSITSVNSDVTAASGATNTTIQITGDNTVAGGNRADFAGVGSNADAITLIDIDAASVFNIPVFVDTLDIDADVNFADALTAENVDVGSGHTAIISNVGATITGDITGGGLLELGTVATLTLGAIGEESTVSIANLDGATPGDGIIAFAAGSMVTIQTAIGANTGIGNFTLNDANTTVTINSTAATSVSGHTTAAETLSLGAGTLILGSNIGNGDTVFSFTGDTGLVTTAGETTTVQLAANVGDGDVITFAATGGDQSTAIDGTAAGTGTLAVTQTALTEFVLSTAGGGGNDNILITANARTTEQAAATLGVSTEEADAVRQASQSGDTTLVDALSTALNAGGATATQAARQVGVQSETVGGGSTVSREMAGQQQRITQDRTGGFRADDPRFVTAFEATQNGETGFAGGDLDAPYTPMGPRYANSVWGQVYGGTALADGTTALAGFDAGFGGAMIGIDGAISDDVVIGAFAGYGFADVDGDGAGDAQLETNAYQAGVYAGYTGASFYVDAFAAYAMLQNDTQRTTLGPNTVTGEFDASQISVGLSGGAPIAISANGYLTPNASLTWNHYDADGYTEVGVGANTVTGFTANTLTGTIGARLHAVYEISDGSAIIPELSAGLIYDIIDDDGRASATFVGGGAAYTVSGTEISNIGAAIGAGLTMRNDVWSVGLSYDGDIRSDFMSHTGRAEVRMRF